MSFTIDDADNIRQIFQLIKDIKDLELHIDTSDMKLSVWKGNIGERTRESTVAQARQGAAAPVAAPEAVKEEPKETEALTTEAPTKAAKSEKEIPKGLVAIKASVASVFYRRPRPEEPPFVEVGSEVEEVTVVCLLEVMKCFNSVTAGVKGRVEKILAENSQLVEYGEVLFLIRPA